MYIYCNIDLNLDDIRKKLQHKPDETLFQKAKRYVICDCLFKNNADPVSVAVWNRKLINNATKEGFGTIALRLEQFSYEQFCRIHEQIFRMEFLIFKGDI